MTMSELIDVLEKAAEGSEPLDRELATLCNAAWSPDEDGQFGGYNILPRRCRFTRSLDAALTLVPADANWSISFNDGTGGYDAAVWRGLRGFDQADDEGAYHVMGYQGLPAIALCIAALNALKKDAEPGVEGGT